MLCELDLQPVWESGSKFSSNELNLIDMFYLVQAISWDKLPNSITEKVPFALWKIGQYLTQYSIYFGQWELEI
jgi:hypothetical protein